MKQWLAETHGVSFELFRHFLLRFFDSDLVTNTSQWTSVVIGAFSLGLPVFLLVAQILAHKYSVLSGLPDPEPYRHAVRADELWLLTLGMAVIGLLAAVKWQSLFPALRDYLALGALPVRAWQIFVAKLLALLSVVSAVIITLDLMPSFGFPSVSMSRWQWNPSYFAHVLAHGTASVAACYFVFFALVGCQGILLHLLPRRWFASITVYLQGLLITAMLVVATLSFSIDSSIESALLRADAARWLPPVWFLGLYQDLLGDGAFHGLGRRALVALAIAVGAALVSYLLSYHRYRELAVEGVARASGESKLYAFLLDRLVPSPRQQAVFAFLGKTLARSAQHRMVLMGYAGLSLAMAFSGMIGMNRLVRSWQVMTSYFVYAHIVALVFLLIGLRHLFSIPAELRANWLFRVTELEGRAEWLRAVDRFTLGLLGLAIFILPLPLEARLLGGRAVSEGVLFLAGGLLYYQAFFYEPLKLPFTCSYLPGKRPAWQIVLWFLTLTGLLPVLNVILVNVLDNRAAFAYVLTALAASCIALYRSRSLSWAGFPLLYEDEPEPDVRTLNLGRR